MRTSLDLAMIRWQVTCRRWHELSSNSAPILGAFLSGWYWRDMGNPLPNAEDIGVFKDSFRAGWVESDGQIEIAERESLHECCGHQKPNHATYCNEAAGN